MGIATAWDTPAPISVAGDLPRPASAGRVLLVDDDAVNRTISGAILRRAGFEVVFASRGSEALAITAANPPDLVKALVCERFGMLRRIDTVWTGVVGSRTVDPLGAAWHPEPGLEPTNRSDSHWLGEGTC